MISKYYVWIQVFYYDIQFINFNLQNNYKKLNQTEKNQLSNKNSIQFYCDN